MELLVKIWEGIRELLEVPNESRGSFFRHLRVGALWLLQGDSCLSKQSNIREAMGVKIQLFQEDKSLVRETQFSCIPPSNFLVSVLDH